VTANKLNRRPSWLGGLRVSTQDRTSQQEELELYWPVVEEECGCQQRGTRWPWQRWGI